MNTILETERLVLRELNPTDAENFYRLNLNPNVIKYTGDRAFESIENAKEFLENYTDYKVNGCGRWAVIDRFSNDFLGWCGLKYNRDLDETDIGFRFFEEHWNKGYATESATACLQYGFQKLSLTKIIGRAMAENKASIKVLEKIGLEFVKEFQFDGLNKGFIYKIDKGDLIN